MMTENSTSDISSDPTAASTDPVDTFPHLTDLKSHLPPSVPQQPHFTDEAILILSKFGRVRNDAFDTWVDEGTDYDDVDAKSLELYNWLALSLVLTPDDVIALTTYVYHDGFKIIASTQRQSEDTLRHANEFADIVRIVVSQNVDLVEFRALYFRCLLRNCRAMIDFRYHELRRAMFQMTDSSDQDDGDMRVRKTALEELTRVVRTQKVLRNGFADRYGEADDEAENLVGNKNIYVCLGILFASLKRAIAVPPKDDTIANLCVICWILARSRVLHSCVFRANPASANLMSKLGAMGEYYRGVGLLHELMENGVYKRYFEGLKIEFIPPPRPRKVELQDDWFHVLKTIYSRVKGGLNLRRASNFTVPGVYQRAVHEYTAHLSSGFTAHPEKHLLQFLISRGYQARQMGVSRHGCVLCATYFEVLNTTEEIKFEVQNYERVSWSIGGRSGNVDMWARDEEPEGVFATAEAAVKAIIEKEVCVIATDLVKSRSED